MTNYSEHELYLRKVLSNSIASINPSDDAKKDARRTTALGKRRI